MRLRRSGLLAMLERFDDARLVAGDERGRGGGVGDEHDAATSAKGNRPMVRRVRARLGETGAVTTEPA